MIRRLTPSLVLIFFLFFCACVAHWASRRALTDAKAQLASSSDKSTELRERLIRSIQEEARIRQHILEYEALKAQGTIGQEQRLAWSETVRKIQEGLELDAANFSLSPRQAYNKGSLGSLHQSTMAWQASLLHEGKLLSLLEALSGIESAIVWPGQCRIEAIDDPRGTSGRLEAKCRFEWLTFDPEAGGRS